MSVARDDSDDDDDTADEDEDEDDEDEDEDDDTAAAAVELDSLDPLPATLSGAMLTEAQINTRGSSDPTSLSKHEPGAERVALPRVAHNALPNVLKAATKTKESRD